jgi:signal transduction histidine kinase
MSEASSATEPAAVSVPPVASRIYAVLLALCALAFLPAALPAAAARPADALLWTVFIAAASLFAIPVLPSLDVDVSAPVSVSAAVVLSPPLALLVNVVGFTSRRELRRQTSVWPPIFNRAQVGLSAGAASWAAHWSASWALPSPLELLIPTLIAVAVHNTLNTVAVAVWLWTRTGMRLQQAAARSQTPIPRFAVEYGLAALLALLIVITHQQVGPVALVLVALPLGLGHAALRTARIAEDRAEELAARVRELETLNATATRLLTARGADHAGTIALAALRTALDQDDVAVSLDGQVPAHLAPVKVPGAEPAVLGVPEGLPERSMAVVEAVAGLLGMTLQRQELELELQAVERARAALSGRILEEGNLERSRLAVNIHDEVLPYLAAGEIQADNMRSAMNGGDLVRADQIAAATRTAVHDGIKRLREVIEALRTQVLVPGGLIDGLRDSIADLRLRHGVEGALCVPDEVPEIPFALEILLLETVRGCLANIGLHAGAATCTVALSVTDRMIAVEVTDDGQGFDPTAVPEGHHGLALMAQRVEIARGRFLADSAHGRGSRIRVEVPL